MEWREHIIVKISIEWVSLKYKKLLLKQKAIRSKNVNYFILGLKILKNTFIINS